MGWLPIVTSERPKDTDISVLSNCYWWRNRNSDRNTQTENFRNRIVSTFLTLGTSVLHTKVVASVVRKCLTMFFFFFFFFLDFGLSRLTSLQFIQYHVAGFYKLTIPQSLPSHLRYYSTCNTARLEFFLQFLFQALIQMNGARKMVSIVGVWTQDLSVMSLLP